MGGGPYAFYYSQLFSLSRAPEKHNMMEKDDFTVEISSYGANR